MLIADLITLAQARLTHLRNRMASAMADGDAAALTLLEQSITETEDTLARLLAVA